ncbi:MAG TPA: homoserine kinase [Chthoniobacteraceae bacterium]|nr:homoserine kinase [Chthoniobacteraceae bacterium]
MDSVTIRVPATSANLGPGYDCLGLALALYNQTELRRATPATPPPEMVRITADLFFERAEVKPFVFGWKIEGEVPRSRGLGSSVTVRLGLLHALNELSDEPLEREELFQLCAELEGHPDNAAPAEFGGFTVASAEGCLSFPVEEALQVVLLIPEFEVSTPEARKVLPETVPHREAVTSAANAARVTAAFASGRYSALEGCFEDYLHQPYRQKLLPFLPEVIAAATRSWAIGGFLSGSGSTIAALTLENAKGVATAMLEALPAGVTAQTVITRVDNHGVQRV